MIWLAPTAAIVVALVTGFFAWYVPAWKLRRETRLETARALRHTRDPLLRAAFDLQSRLYNIVARDFLSRYLKNGTDDEKRYAVMSTLWLVGQYLGWVEILRREVQYLDLGSRSVNRRLQLRLSEVGAALASDARRQEDAFMIFRADQRAVGEFMVTSRETNAGGKRPDCLGYSEFLERFQAASLDTERPSMANSPLLAWAERMEGDLASATDTPRNALRLVMVQHRLIDLVDLLDPDRVRYPELNFRGKLGPQPQERGRRKSTAHFLWRHEAPWPAVETWADATGFQSDSDSESSRRYRGRRGPTLRRPEVLVEYEGGWVTIDACMKRMSHARPIDGSLRVARGRRALNSLLDAFGRPTVADAATVPARIGKSVVTLFQRLRRGDEDHES